MKNSFFIFGCVLLAASCLVSCKKKSSDAPKTVEEVRAKVEEVAMAYAKVDGDLGAYDSIKFVTYDTYYKHTYCDYMCKLLGLQRENLQAKMDSAIEVRDNVRISELSSQMDTMLPSIDKAIEFYKAQSYNTLSTKNDPIVGYEAKCYSYTDGYIEEAIYFVSKDWKVGPYDPYNFSIVK